MKRAPSPLTFLSCSITPFFALTMQATCVLSFLFLDAGMIKKEFHFSVRVSRWVIKMKHSLSFSCVQHLKTRLNGAKVHCVDRVTSWQPRSDASIMYLDRQNVQCPPSYFLARFRLGRKGDYNSAEVRYYFKCCSLNI